MDQASFRLQFPAETVEIDGLAWSVIDSRPAQADAPALLMLPGTLGTAEIFWNQIAALADQVRILAVTYPVSDDALWQVDGLAALCRARGIDRTSVVGSSLGGFLAQWLAARHPALVETLFIGNSLSDPAIANVTGHDLAALRALPAEAHRGFILASVESWPETTPAVTRLKAVLRDSGNRLLSSEALKARILTLRGADAVPPLGLPANRVVVIDCADDPLIPQAVQDDVLARYPGAEHRRLAFGGHYPYVVDPDTYTAILASYLLPGKGA